MLPTRRMPLFGFNAHRYVTSGEMAFFFWHRPSLLARRWYHSIGSVDAAMSTATFSGETSDRIFSAVDGAAHGRPVHELHFVQLMMDTE